MAPILTTVVFEHLSARIEDRYINDFTFLTASTGVVDTELATIESYLIGFYNTVQSGTSRSIAALMSTVIDRTADKAKFIHYDLTGHLDGSPHGSPVRTRTWQLGPATAGPANHPSEVSIALSYRSAYGSDVEFGPEQPRPPDLPPSTKPYRPRPRARDRGRIFIGPLNVGGQTQDSTTNAPRPGTSYINTFTAAAATLVGQPTPSWAQWSRRNATLDPVVGGWVDNAYDTQRRRGEDPTARTTWGATAFGRAGV